MFLLTAVRDLTTRIFPPPQWLAVPNHSNDPACPVCKAVIEMPNLDPSKAKVIPLYVNGKSEADPRT